MLDSVPVSPSNEVIVVTGTALPDPASSHAFHSDNIEQKELRDAPAHELDEILKQVPGLQLFRRSDSTSGHPTSQGLTLRAMGGNASSRALLILDGVPQADPFGGWVNWPAYDAAGLDRIQIVRGGGSVPYGAGALAGVIEMSSLASLGFNASVEAGSRESVRAHFYGGAQIGRALLTLDTQAARSDGFVPTTKDTRGPVDHAAPYDEGSARLRWNVPLSNEIEAQFSGLAFIDKRARGVDLTDNRTRGGDASVRVVGRGIWQWSALAYTQARNLRSSFASVNDDRSAAMRVSLQDSVPSSSLGFSTELRPPSLDAIDLRIGADGRFTSGESREFYSYANGQPTRRRVAGGDSATQGLFAEASSRHGSFGFSAGARIDHWKISGGRLVERLLDGGTVTRDDQYPRRDGWLPTARAVIVVYAADGLNFRAAAYRGWRLPTLNELFRPFRAGADATAANPSLKPEALTGAEAGLEFSHGVVDLSITAFTNRLSDAIANVTLGRGPGNFPGVGFVGGDYRQRQNVEAIAVRGVEATGEVREGPWRVRFGGSYNDATVHGRDLASALDGLRPAQTPRLVLSTAIGWESNRRSYSLQLRHVGAQFEDDQNSRKLSPATTLDAFASWPLSKKADLVLRGENILNQTVEAGIGDDGSIERATPRTLWLGLRIASQ